MVLGLLLALMVRDRGPRWLPAWIACVLALSFTRDLTIVLVLATGWLAFRERSRLMAIVAGAGALASAPAPLIFSAPLRENLAYAFNDYRIPSDTSWGAILSDYPSRLFDLIKQDVKYPASSPFPLILTLAMGIVVIAGLVCLYRPWRHRDPFLSLVRAATVGGIITILISVNVTSLRLELVFIPAVATGVGLLVEHVLARHSTLPAHEPSAVPT